MCQDRDACLGRVGRIWASRLVRAGRNLDAELQQELIADACLYPGWILADHFRDQLAKLTRMRGALVETPPPAELDAVAVPADQGFWFDDDQGISPMAEPAPKWQAETSRGGRWAWSNLMLLIKD